MSRIYDLNRRVNKNIPDNLEGELIINIPSLVGDPLYIFNGLPLDDRKKEILFKRLNNSNNKISFTISLLD